jgi:hypothetical protein
MAAMPIAVASPPLIIIRMHPFIRRDLALHGQLDQMHADLET